MSEPPDEARQHNGRGKPAHQFPQKRDGEHAEHEFLGDGRQISAHQHEEPGEFGIEEIAVGHVGGRPRAVLVRHDVEDGLVGDENGAQRHAQNRAQEEAFGAQAAQAEQAAQRDFAGECFAVEHLRAGRDDEQRAAPGERLQ